MNRLSIFACGAVSSLSLLSIPVSAHGDASPPKPQLEGAWQVIVTLRVDAPDCTTAAIAPGPNPFLTLNTFHRGGTMSEYGTRSPPSTRTSGHGIWKRTGNRSFEYRAVFYSFTADVLAATMDFRADLKLARRGDTFEGIARLIRTEVSGNELHFCATLSGERLSL